MSLINFYTQTSVKAPKYINPGYKTHGIDVPFQWLLAGGTGCGKSNLTLNALVLFNKTFHEIILSVKSADEPLYQHLIDKLPNVIVYENGSVPDINDFATVKDGKVKSKDKKQRLIIFDDLVLENASIQKQIAFYWIKGRKVGGGISCCYISQSFYMIPKQIRINTSIITLGRNLQKRDLREIIRIFPTDMTAEQFYSLYMRMTNDPMNTMTIFIKKKCIRQNIIGEEVSL